MNVKSDSIYEFNKSPLLLLAAFQLLCERTRFLREFYPLLNPAHWGEMELRWIAARCMEYYEKYQKAPQLGTMRIMLEADRQTDDETKKLILRILNKLDEVDVEDATRLYLVDHFEDYIRYRATLYAVHEAQALIKDGDLEQAVQVIIDSQQVRKYNDNWLSLPADADKFFDFFGPAALQYRTVPIDIPPLDRKMSGGARRGELGVIVAPLGYGKSQMLVHIGAAAVRRGLKVVHFTMENSEEETLARYMYNLLSIDSDVLQSYDLANERYQSRLEEMKEWNGQVKILRLAGSVTTAVDLSGYLHRLEEQDTPWRADVVIVDYGDLMTASRLSSHQSKKYEELQTVFEELRELAAAHEVVLWTASQANREGIKSRRHVRLEHIADALGKAFTADIIISMSKDVKAQEGRQITDTGEDSEDDTDNTSDNGIRILHLLKMRRGGSDNWFARAKTRYAQAKLVAEDWEEDADDNDEMKATAFIRWGAKARRKADDAPKA